MCGLKIPRVAGSLSLLGVREYGDREHLYQGLEALSLGLSPVLDTWIPCTDTKVTKTSVWTCGGAASFKTSQRVPRCKLGAD